jgi:hypothetical protein
MGAPCVWVRPELYALRVPFDTTPNVLEALEGRASGDCHRSNGADNAQELDQTTLHESLPRSLVALVPALGFHARTSFGGLRVLGGHENRPDTAVGRLHYSLNSTLSAHFRWGVRASERLNVPS